MRKIIVGLLVAVAASLAVVPAQAAVNKPTVDSWTWFKNVYCKAGQECGGATHLVGFNVWSTGKVKFNAVGTQCNKRLVYADLSKKAAVPIVKGKIDETYGFRTGGKRYDVRLAFTFTTARKAVGWYKVTGGKCSGAKVSFTAKPEFS